MPLASYGVLQCAVRGRSPGTATDTHYHIHGFDGRQDWRIAVDVRSKDGSEVLFFVDENFQNPILQRIGNLGQGFRALRSVPGSLALDYLRGSLFPLGSLRPLPITDPQAHNDLDTRLDRYVLRAQADATARVYAFGTKFGPDPQPDHYFGFSPAIGVHNVHMNQGNSGHFAREDGPYQDGALLLHFPAKGQWVAVFLAFQSQSFQTGRRTGHRA